MLFKTVYNLSDMGLNNIKKRIELVYGSQVVYAFYNTNPGCVAEIMIPIQNQLKEGESNECPSD